MSKFINNVNTYLSQMKIKQKYVSLKSGINEKKLSRILNSEQEVDGDDMEKIAAVLGHKAEYFFADDFKTPIYEDSDSREFAFYDDAPAKEQNEFAMKLIDLIENIDEILSADMRFKNAFFE